jgi:hypothetical protein
MNQDDCPRHHPAQSRGTTRATVASSQWHDAELAMKLARHSFDRWRAAGYEEASSSAQRHVYCTHEALHEAARAITMLIDTIRVEVAALITTPAQDLGIPAQHR